MASTFFIVNACAQYCQFSLYRDYIFTHCIGYKKAPISMMKAFTKNSVLAATNPELTVRPLQKACCPQEMRRLADFLASAVDPDQKL